MMTITFDDREYGIANPFEAERATNALAFSFGAYGDERVIVWDKSVERGLEEAAEWLDENAPGTFTSDAELAEVYEEGLEEGMSEEEAQEYAETDMTYTEAGWIPSYEWGVSDLDLNSPLAKTAHKKSVDFTEAY